MLVQPYMNNQLNFNEQWLSGLIPVPPEGKLNTLTLLLKSHVLINL